MGQKHGIALTPEHGSFPSQRMREERLDNEPSANDITLVAMLQTHHDRHATLTGGTANGFFRMPVVVFWRVCVSVLMISTSSSDVRKV